MDTFINDIFIRINNCKMTDTEVMNIKKIRYKNKNNYIDLFRNNRKEHYYKRLLMWSNKIDEINMQYDKKIFKKIKKISHKMLVIIEPRKHSHLSGVLKNIVSKIDNNWSMTIFHSSTNYYYLKNIVGENTNIKFINICVDNITISQYSKILLTVSFWENLNAQTILIFQTDTLIRKNNINEYLEYDYIGAPWLKLQKNDENILLDIGNGGLSIRNRLKCIYLLEKYENYIKKYIKHEDMFFSIFFKKENFNIPEYCDAMRFSSEQVFSTATGLHKSYLYMNTYELKILLDF